MKRIKLIGVCGYAGSGKDTVAGIILGPSAAHRKIAFADPIKKFVQEVFDFSNDQVWGSSETRNKPDPRYTRSDGGPLTPRFALQTLGTEWGRHCYPNIWAAVGIRKAVTMLEEDGDYPVVISDVRFLNEAHVIHEAGGFVWRVTRPINPHALKGQAALHPSEADIESREMTAMLDAEIINDDGMDSLIHEVTMAQLRCSATMIEENKNG